MELNTSIIQYHTILNNVLWPIDLTQLRNDILSNGFQLVRSGQILTNGLTIEPDDVAVKNNVVLTISPPTKMVQLSGTEYQAVHQIVKETESILQRQKVSLESSGRLFELKADCVIKTGKNPVKTIQAFYRNNVSHIDSIDKIIDGKPSMQMSIRLMPKDMLLDTEDYHEIRIEPLLRTPKDAYFFEIIFRSSDQKKTQGILFKLEEKIKEIMTVIEQNESRTQSRG